MLIPKSICRSFHYLYFVIDTLYLSCRDMAIIPCKYTGSVCHYASSHFYQLLNFTLLSLPYPIKHNLFGLFLINLGPKFPELLF